MMTAKGLRMRCASVGALSFVLLVFGLSGVASGQGADPAELVQGVSAIVAPGSPGPVHPMSASWWSIAGGDEDASFPSLLVAAREYGSGRVVVCGHDGLPVHPNELDNGVFLLNALHWLDAVGTGQLRYTTGHGEWVTGGGLGDLADLVAGDGMSLSELSSPITLAKLEPVSALLVGNAWGSFTEAEIEVVRLWVQGGGGLFLVGLGWSWEAYHPDLGMDDYPMMQLAEPYGIRWLRAGIHDPTDQHQGSPVFSVMYPEVYSATVAESLDLLSARHTQFGSSVISLLDSDDAFRLEFVRAHQTLAIPTSEFPPDHAERGEVFAGYLGLVEGWPGFYARGFSLPEWRFPTAAWVRERAWRSWRDAQGLTAERKEIIADTGLLTGIRRDLFMGFGLVLLDNDRLGEPEIGLIQETLTLTPRHLFELQCISVVDYLGESALPISLAGVPYGVNVFGIDIGDWTENPFPADVERHDGDGFFSVLAHEVNHVVDATTIGRSAELAARKRGLIADAGEEPLNYLRSMISGGFFVENPQEFFASISNQWLNNSQRTIELGLIRFDAGRPDPINQALFFADVYSGGGGVSHFYLTDAAGQIERREVGLERDNSGWITDLVDGAIRYEFEVDSAGRVTGYAVVAVCPPDLNGDGVVNTQDFLLFLNLYVTGEPIADWNGDGVINTQDFLAFLNEFASGC
jgi:hypothetical protein